MSPWSHFEEAEGRSGRWGKEPPSFLFEGDFPDMVTLHSIQSQWPELWYEAKTNCKEAIITVGRHALSGGHHTNTCLTWDSNLPLTGPRVRASSTPLHCLPPPLSSGFLWVRAETQPGFFFNVPWNWACLGDSVFLLWLCAGSEMVWKCNECWFGCYK